MSAVARRVLVACLSGAILVSLCSAPTVAASKPATPTGLAARAGNSTAVLTWSPAARATHYRVCVLTTKTQTRCGSSASPRLTEPTYRATKLKSRSGTDYYFRVYAYNAAGRTASAVRGFELQRTVTPAAPTGIKQTVTSSTLTISWAAARDALDYSVCLTGGQTSTRCLQSSPRSATRSVTFTGLTPTAGGDYFYRVQAFNRTRSALSAQQRADLPVGTIASATATNGGSGAFEAQWEPAVNAETYELQVATNAAMASSTRSYTVTGTATTPRLTIGTTYYYRVRGLNGVSKGAWTKAARLRLPSTPATIRVMTYNLCGQDKCVTKSNRMKKWSTRRTYAGRLVRGSDADIIATQESHDKDTRFGRELPGYGLAAYYSAKSLFYDQDKYDVRRSGTITLNSKERKYAVWAELRESASRTTFIVVDAHLQPYKGKVKDDMRAAQTRTLISKVKAINPSDLSVVYAGDFNSNKSNADQKRYKGGYDAPHKIFAANGIPDTYDVSTRHVHADFNSANQAINPPLRHADHVDHIYADPEVTVSSWRVWVKLDGKNYETPFATDHNPVRAVLTVPGR